MSTQLVNKSLCQTGEKVNPPAAIFGDSAPNPQGGGVMNSANLPSLEPTLELLVARINVAHAEATAYAGKAIERALEAGDLLIQAKGRVAHGDWQSWLRQHCPNISPRTVQNYMRIARELPAEKRTDAHLTVNGALKLLAGPAPEAPAIANENEPGFDCLPKLGERAALYDDEWEWFIAESSQNPGYYWLARFMWSDDDEGGGISSVFRRPMDARGITMFLAHHHVLNKEWNLEEDNGAIECFGQIEEERYRREHWPSRAAPTATTEAQS